ncbi:MAG: cellulase family glycosylhydrolase [Pirellulales bacterium]
MGRLVRGGLCLWAAIATFSAARADLFHGLNAGAPVWNGSVVLTPQKAAEFAATGTQSIRVNFRLDSGATSWNAAQLAMYDQVIANARNAGLQVLGLFSNETVAGGQAAWNDDPDLDGFNSYVSQYASTAQLLVNRYQNDVQQWELWNEPNAWTNPGYASDPKNAGGTYILPRVYARLLSETYRALDADALVGSGGAQLVSGGLFAHDIGGSFSTALDYMQQVYNQGGVWDSLQSDVGRRYPWDDFGYHFYISQGSAVPTSQLANYFNAVRATQASNNDPSGVVVTEFGWQTVGTNTQELQRDNMATAYDFLESKAYVGGTYWYQWTDDGTGGWGIVNGANQPKLSYHEFVARNGGGGGPNLRVTTEHALSDAALSTHFSNSDLLQGRIPTVLAGDIGWHSANPASTNPNDPNGLAAFTDGVGDLGSGVTGLLNDFPTPGSPAKLVSYDLAAPHDIDEIRIFTGNNGKDGRIFSTTAVWTSTDGVDYDLLGYFQSDPSGSQNNASTPGGAKGSTLVRIFHDDGTPIVEGVTHLRFDFYAAANIPGVMLDPFDGVNPFTGIDDGLAAAYVSPLVREIDVLGALSVLPAGDYDRSGTVDAADYAKWRATFGSNVDLAADGNGDGVINAGDYTIWRDAFGNTAGLAATVPEPAVWLQLFAASAALCLAKGRGRRPCGPPPSRI